MNLYPALVRVVKLFFPKVTVVIDGAAIEQPAIFVANHADSFGPLALYLYFPIKLYPWVMYDLTDRKACARYLEKDFTSRELGLPRPFSTWLAIIIASVCVGLMRYIQAIPVYHNSRRIMETISKSIVYIEEGRSLLIFPEVPDSLLGRYIKRFNIGFLDIAKKLERETHKTLRIYPVSVDRKRRRIAVGNPSFYVLARGYANEKKRIENELETEVERMLSRA